MIEEPEQVPLPDEDEQPADPAMEPVEEAGGGVAEGFEGSEKLLEENAEGERDDDPLRNPFNSEVEEQDSGQESGEADHVNEADDD